MAKSKSKLTLSQRRDEAFKLFARGYTNLAVAAELGVNKDTVAGYRRRYEDSIQTRAAAQPDLLAQVMANTVRSLEELDMIREDAWSHMKPRTIKTVRECPECEHKWTERITIEVSDQTRAQYHNVLLKAQDQRNKLFGLLGVKQEMFAHVENVRQLSGKILSWMGEHLCNIDREKLARFLETDLRQHLGLGAAELIAAGSPIDAVIDARETELEEDGLE